MKMAIRSLALIAAAISLAACVVEPAPLPPPPGPAPVAVAPYGCCYAYPEYPPYPYYYGYYGPSVGVVVGDGGWHGGGYGWRR